MCLQKVNNFSKEIILLEDQLLYLRFCFIKSDKLVLLKKEGNNYVYFLIPFGIYLKKKKKSILFSRQNTPFIEFISFIRNFSKWLKFYDKTFKKRLILKGLGLRINLVEDSKCYFLKFKLGLSHLVEFKLLKEKVTLIVKKNTLSLKGEDNGFIGNTCKKIKSLKLPNSYTGKGFCYKSEKIVCKTFKKK